MDRIRLGREVLMNRILEEFEEDEKERLALIMEKLVGTVSPGLLGNWAIDTRSRR